jgi:hypothetical protein
MNRSQFGIRLTKDNMSGRVTNRTLPRARDWQPSSHRTMAPGALLTDGTDVDSHGGKFGARLEAFGYRPPYAGREHRRRRQLRRRGARAVEGVTAAPRDPPEVQAQGHGVGRARNVNSTFGWYWTADLGAAVTKTMSI